MSERATWEAIEGASIDPRLVAVAAALAQCLPGRQLLRAHPLAVIQAVVNLQQPGQLRAMCRRRQGSLDV